MRRQRLPAQNVGKRIWDDRLADIAHFEDYLARQGTILLKFFLHVSREEQKKRFMERLDKPRKHWKFSSADIRERGFWGDYMHAFEEAIRTTAAPHAPWFSCRPTTSGSRAQRRRRDRGSGGETV
jgi:polyphosphate kinase 2 (PPK2 family)